MAQKLYKWTGEVHEPVEWDSDYEAPMWHGTDLSTGMSYATLNTGFAAMCTSTNDDFAATTAQAAKTWVKKNSPYAKQINLDCQEAIRASYSLTDELKAHRINDTAVLTAIGDIVATHTAKKNALVGD